jgi:hypothetical protein
MPQERTITFAEHPLSNPNVQLEPSRTHENDGCNPLSSPVVTLIPTQLELT